MPFLLKGFLARLTIMDAAGVANIDKRPMRTKRRPPKGVEMDYQQEMKRVRGMVQSTGWAYREHQSNLSSSRYITLDPPRNFGSQGRSIEIRISDHSQRADYFQPVDYEIGPHAGAYPSAAHPEFVRRLSADVGLSPAAAERAIKQGQPAKWLIRWCWVTVLFLIFVPGLYGGVWWPGIICGIVGLLALRFRRYWELALSSVLWVVLILTRWTGWMTPQW